MSINFRPTQGLWTEFTYRTVDEDSPTIGPGETCEHHIIRCEDEQPIVQCHNSGGYWLLDQLGLHSESCGEATSGEIEHLLSKVDAALRQSCFEPLGDYEYRKLLAAQQMLLHCKYHGCGFTWG